MTDIDDALAASSLGTPEARAIIESVPEDVARYYIDKYAEAEKRIDALPEPRPTRSIDDPDGYQ